MRPRTASTRSGALTARKEKGRPSPHKVDKDKNEEEGKDRKAVPLQHEELVGGRVPEHLAHQAEQAHQQLLARAILGLTFAARRLRVRQPREEREEQPHAAEALR